MAKSKIVRVLEHARATRGRQWLTGTEIYELQREIMEPHEYTWSANVHFSHLSQQTKRGTIVRRRMNGNGPFEYSLKENES